MLLAIDIGNARIKLGVFRESGLVVRRRMASDPRWTEDQFAAALQAQLALSSLSAREIDGAILSCVVPGLTRPAAKAVEELCGCETLVVGPGVKTGLDVRVDHPTALGSDLVCGAVGALTLCRAPLVVLDFGTAATLTAIDRTGAMVGRLITAGPQTALDALADHAALLPHVSLPSSGVRRDFLGRDTAQAMENGVLYGTAAMAEGLFGRCRELLGEETSCIVTGGGAEAVAPYCRFPLRLEPDLVLRGLHAIYRRNRP